MVSVLLQLVEKMKMPQLKKHGAHGGADGSPCGVWPACAAMRRCLLPIPGWTGAQACPHACRLAWARLIACRAAHWLCRWPTPRPPGALLWPAVWIGALTGVAISVLIGVVFIVLFYVAGEKIFTGNSQASARPRPPASLRSASPTAPHPPLCLCHDHRRRCFPRPRRPFSRAWCRGWPPCSSPWWPSTCSSSTTWSASGGASWRAPCTWTERLVGGGCASGSLAPVGGCTSRGGGRLAGRACRGAHLGAAGWAPVPRCWIP